jgi:hypothetical protein
LRNKIPFITEDYSFMSDWHRTSDNKKGHSFPLK